MEKLTRGMICEVKDVDGDERVLEFVGSTEAVDRDQEVIRADGWDLNNYLKNPVILWAHNYYDPPVGKSVKTWIEDKQLKFRVKFPSEDEYAEANTLYKLYKGGYLNSTSVGFIPRKWEDGNEEGDPRRTYTKQELLELSLVPVPANPEAVMQRMTKAVEDEAVTEPALQSLLEYIEKIQGDMEFLDSVEDVDPLDVIANEYISDPETPELKDFAWVNLMGQTISIRANQDEDGAEWYYTIDGLKYVKELEPETKTVYKCMDCGSVVDVKCPLCQDSNQAHYADEVIQSLKDIQSDSGLSEEDLIGAVKLLKE